MTKARKTTLKERVEITQFTIAHGQDYQLAVEKYKVSYQQVYSWVKKYQESGEAGLEDRRGHKKK
ncbi:helix-turn-helix domain-containing protein [Enterococcus sp.]|uniref:helix-turn-helix domain-containing protein n=1 Tax=Enterococcus sp. TaxID=35783 RepID=UPI002FC8DFA1